MKCLKVTDSFFDDRNTELFSKEQATTQGTKLWKINSSNTKFVWTLMHFCNNSITVCSTPIWNLRNKSAETLYGFLNASPRNIAPKSTIIFPSCNYFHSIDITWPSVCKQLASLFWFLAWIFIFILFL